VLAGHAGDEVRQVTSWFGRDVDLYVVLHRPADVAASLSSAGLKRIEWYVRGPIEARQETTDRFYAIARALHH
jgi:hypothetical protein